ncbi:glycosyltransferase family 1 protein [Stutzerimonas zhaodongensis]|jgi:glycosyltransferase involved in cell wall biosynthesis|uniref:Glycosyltransferase family 1 protein n=1 Tax=Stutzerimonas zhaodongensis TaxID=1176257 RepID=A0A365PT52_9GAMM|nr:glycosyltransferase family 1 protein [Stutzerimonas zhaodongensis]RBA56869.1 glycosyltransferase family 1 protein [Stutzerimonas zhaodongensis]
MKLLINTESLLPPLTGIGNYTLHLLKELLVLQQEDEALQQIDCISGNQFISATEAMTKCHIAEQSFDNTKPRISPLRRAIRRIPLAYQIRQALHDLRLAQQRRQYRHHLYHEPNFILKSHPGPCVATIHDLSFIHYPQHHPAERVTWMRGNLQKTLDRADRLITVSNIVRQELIGDLGVPADKIQTTYLGVDPSFHPRNPAQTQRLMDKYNLRHGGYVLFVGTLEPRKGLDLLLDAWTSLPLAIQHSYKLVLAGASGWHNADLLERVQSLEMHGDVCWLRYIPLEELPLLYSGAAAFSYPSLYEGFGLPVLEAMASGVPVVCTDDTSMAEFAAHAPLLFERGKSEEFGEQLRLLLEDSSLRERHSALGLERASHFSWRRFAEETLTVYRTAYEG